MEIDDIEEDILAILQMGMELEDTAREIIQYMADHPTRIHNALYEIEGD